MNMPVQLRLFVTGRTISAERARAALAGMMRDIAGTPGAETIQAEVIDVLDAPDDAARAGVFATPMVVRLGPGPEVRLFGDLSSAERLAEGLGLRRVAQGGDGGQDAQPWLHVLTPSSTSSSPAAVRG